MATNQKKLSRAKAEKACETIDTLLCGTGHDVRMDNGLRVLLGICLSDLQILVKKLREDER